MKEISIEDLAYFIKEAKEDNQPQPIFFLGAGASVSGNIPLARKIVKDILEEYAKNPNIKKLKKEDQTYDKLMDCLSPDKRNKLLKKYIDAAKINVTHIYLAQLLDYGYADYILTVNFDNLMLRALALYNTFPPTYDMAILKDLTTTTFKKKSVVYLHGQHHGLWLLNTKDEMNKVQTIVPRIFDGIKNERPWIFIGYSGNDPIFEHVKNLGRFDNGLYWVGYNDSEPNSQVKDFLTTPNTNAFYIKGYDADAFMLKLNEELELPQPKILSKPFSALQATLNEINDINDEEHFKGVKERLEISKKNVIKSINTFELGQKDSITDTEIEVDNLKKEIIELTLSETYDEDIISELEIKVKNINDTELNNSLYNLFFNWGYYLGELAKTKQSKEKELFLVKASEKYQKATILNSNKHLAFYNWGVNLRRLSDIKSGKEAEKLLNQTIEKYQKTIKIKPDYHNAYNNWGAALTRIAKTKQEQEAEKLFQLAFEKYQKAIDIKPDKSEAFYNWGNALSDLAKTKKGQNAEELFRLAFEKLKKGVKLGGNPYNLACLYALKNKKEKAMHYLELSLQDDENTVTHFIEDPDWKDYLEDPDFLAIIEKHKE